MYTTHNNHLFHLYNIFWSSLSSPSTPRRPPKPTKLYVFTLSQKKMHKKQKSEQPTTTKSHTMESVIHCPITLGMRPTCSVVDIPVSRKNKKQKRSLLEQTDRGVKNTVPLTTAPERKILKINRIRWKTHAEMGKQTQTNQRTSALRKQKTYCVVMIPVLPKPTHIPKDAHAAQVTLHL